MRNRAVIYARISRDREGREVGVDNQVATCRKIAERHGLTVQRVYVDNDRGASSLSKKPRLDYQAMTAAAKRGEFEWIIAYSMSRVSRRPAEWEELIALSANDGIQFLYEVSPRYDLNTADGRATARTVSAWDAAEAERTGERVRHAKAATLAAGKDIGGPRPFGWEPDRRTHRAAEADLIRSGAAAILAGASVRSVAMAWNQSGITPPRAGVNNRGGRPASSFWRPQTVRSILSNPRQIGHMVVKGVDYGQVADPILTDEDHAALLAIFANPARKPKRGPEPLKSTALQLVTCGVCGGQMRLANSRGHRYVKCADASYEPGPHPSVAAHIAEEQLGLGALWLLIGQQPEDYADARPEVAALQLRIADDKMRLERVTAAYIDGIGDLDHLARESATLKAAIASGQERLDTLLAANDSAGAVAVARQFVDGWGDDVSSVGYLPALREPWLEYWHSIDVAARRRLLRGLSQDIRTAFATEEHPGRFTYDQSTIDPTTAF
ncbi:site-specific DNA recombinase [Microbacterium sp. ZKA21]|uniref:recombinase family protein n=1 Tax=Microbacterium sp. ZKA21 TaxID=3381694 RepID=UPI003D25D3EF